MLALWERIYRSSAYPKRIERIKRIVSGLWGVSRLASSKVRKLREEYYDDFLRTSGNERQRSRGNGYGDVYSENAGLRPVRSFLYNVIYL